MTNDFHIENGVLKSYTGREESITVPEQIHTIGEGALKGCVSLKKVVLPAGLRHIQSGAFKGCRRLEEIEIPAGVTYVGDYAFHRCHSLKSISLPPSVKELGDCVFLYCDSLTDVRIPGVEHLGIQVFVNDVLIKKIQISPKLEEACICDVFTGCSRISEISFSDGRRFTFPNAVEVVAGEAQVPPLVRAIAVDILRMMELEGRRLAEFLINLKHVEIPEGIEKIGKSAFFDKRGIISVKLPSTLREIESRAFRNCISLEAVEFQQSQAVIHEDAFKNCSSLKEVRTPDGVSHRMEGISGLSGEEVPALVKEIHRQVLGNFRLSGSILLKYLGNESRVVIPEGVVCIAEEAFAGNEAVERVILPDTVEAIGAGAFRNCLILQTVNFPSRVRYIGTGAFENCVKLLRVQLPDGLEKVEDQVFKHCRRLKELSFGKAVRAIGEQAFYGCLSMREIDFPHGLVSMGSMAFYRCRALNEVHILPGTEAVGNLAFAQSGVKKVWIEASGRGFGSDLFFQCTGLRTMVLEKGVHHVPDKLAYGCTALKYVSLPDTLESAGRNAWEYTPFLRDWLENRDENRGRIFWDGRDLKGVVVLPKETQIVAGGAFYGNHTLTAVRFPDGVTWVGRAALKGCASLRRVIWTAAVTTAQPEVFSGCVSLEAVVSGEMSLEAAASGKMSSETAVSGKMNSEAAASGKMSSEAAVSGEMSSEAAASGEMSSEAAASGKMSSEAVVPGEMSLEAAVSGEMSSEAAASEEMGPEAAASCSYSLGTGAPSGDCFVEDIPWTTIGERAFYNCRKLSHILWKDVREVGREAFSGCTSLSLGKADSLRQVGEGAFEGVGGLGEISGMSVVGGIIVSGSRCLGEIQVPEGITAIAPFAFSGNRQITKVVFPKTLCRIGEGAFFGCCGLTEIYFPSALRAVGARAFEKCTGLKKVCLHADTVGPAAFAYCLSLEKAELQGPAALESRLFEGCENLKECICEQASEIGASCFSGCKKLESFDFRFIQEIGSYGFQDCDMLREITFGGHTLVRPHGFEDCGRLERIVLKGSQSPLELCEYALSGCTALRQVVWQGQRWEPGTYRELFSERLPEPVRLIFHSALSCFDIDREEILCGYRGLGRIVKIPEGIRRIEAEIFQDILMLEQVDIPETVEYIGARAFHQTAWMERQRELSPMVVVNHMLLDASCCVGEVVVPEDIRLVCGWAFAGGLGIEKIRFLSDRVKVEAFAFRNCIYLRELVLGDGSTVVLEGIADRKKELPALARQAVWDRLNCFKTDEKDALIECTGNISRLLVAEGITAIGDNVFQEGNLLTEITLPRTVTSIGRNAFAGCKWLRGVYGAQSVKAIGSRAFSGCGSLEGIELSEELSELGSRAFENCTSLKEILLPEGLEEIPERAFFRCHSLQRLRLPSTLKRIGKEAFGFCKNLQAPLLPDGVLVEERAFVGTAEPEQGICGSENEASNGENGK